MCVKTERWADVVGYEGVYQVSSIGRVRRIDGKQITPVMKPTIGCKHGYYTVHLCKDSVKRRLRVHRMMLDAFVGPRPNLVAAHLDGVRTNNTIENLVWATPKENMEHKKIHGTDPKGERNPAAVINEKTVHFIDFLRIVRGLTFVQIATIVGLANGTCVRRAYIRETWSHVPRLLCGT